jgi:aminoglycoside phosphotransferase (APT) family kinase protein
MSRVTYHSARAVIPHFLKGGSMKRPHEHDQAALDGLARVLARRLRVGSVELTDVEVPEGGHSAEMLAFTASWVTEDGSHRQQLIARFQPSEIDSRLFKPSIETEWRVQREFARHASVPVPEVLVTDDGGTLGRPFYIMSRIDGRIPCDEPSYHQAGFMQDLNLTDRARLWSNGVECLARIHSVDPGGFTFFDLSKGGSSALNHYLDWVTRWYRWTCGAQTHPVADAALQHLLAHRPTSATDSVLWGDARIGNMIFSADNEVVGVIDWEMTAIGPGEVDLAWWLLMDHLWADGLGVARLPGLPDKDETIGHYEQTLGRKVSNMQYYEILATLRFVIILLRFANVYRGTSLLGANTTVGTNSHAMQHLARLMELDVPELSPDIPRLLLPDLTAAHHDDERSRD